MTTGRTKAKVAGARRDAIAKDNAEKAARIMQFMGIDENTEISFTVEQLLDLQRMNLEDEQSVRAAMPRPKKTPTHRSEVIKEMRRWRDDGNSFDEFLKATDHDTLAITHDARTNRFVVDCDSAISTDKEPGKKKPIPGLSPTQKYVSEKTLREWWTIAGKRP